MFRIAVIALMLSAAPALAITHAECVGLLADAYEAKDKAWQTSEALHQGSGDSEAQESAKSEAVGARLAAQKYINALADYCESLR